MKLKWVLIALIWMRVTHILFAQNDNILSTLDYRTFPSTFSLFVSSLSSSPTAPIDSLPQCFVRSQHLQPTNCHKNLSEYERIALAHGSKSDVWIPIPYYKLPEYYPHDIGESVAFLAWIIEYYECLPQYVVFLHSGPIHWHRDRNIRNLIETGKPERVMKLSQNLVSFPRQVFDYFSLSFRYFLQILSHTHT